MGNLLNLNVSAILGKIPLLFTTIQQLYELYPTVTQRSYRIRIAIQDKVGTYI